LATKLFHALLLSPECAPSPANLILLNLTLLLPATLQVAYLPAQPFLAVQQWFAIFHGKKINSK
jgi:hypothetical protein